MFHHHKTIYAWRNRLSHVVKCFLWKLIWVTLDLRAWATFIQKLLISMFIQKCDNLPLINATGIEDMKMDASCGISLNTSKPKSPYNIIYMYSVLTLRHLLFLYLSENLNTFYCLKMCLNCWILTNSAEFCDVWPRPEVIKLFSCSTQLSMKFSLLINMKMPTIVGIFIFISRENFMLSYV